MSLIAIVIAALNVTATPCHEGDVESYDDASLKVLTGATCLRGSLEVRGKVTSLAPLRALTVIEGDLRIGPAEFLPSLRGLEKLTRVTGNVGLGGPKTGLPRIRRLAGLPSLVEIGGSLFLGGGYVFHRGGGGVDAPLEGIDGLRSLASVKGDVTIFAARSLGGLDALVEIGGDLEINRPGRLPPMTMTGLRRLRRIGGKLDLDSEGVRGVPGLDALVEIGGDVEVNCSGAYAPRFQELMRRQLGDVTVKGKVYYGSSDEPREPIVRCPHLPGAPGMN